MVPYGQSAQIQPQMTAQQVSTPENFENEEGMIKLYYGKKGKVELEETPENIELIKGALDHLKKKLEKKPEKDKT